MTSGCMSVAQVPNEVLPVPLVEPNSELVHMTEWRCSFGWRLRSFFLARPLISARLSREARTELFFLAGDSPVDERGCCSLAGATA